MSVPDGSERCAIIEAHAEYVNLETVYALKSRADLIERDDARQAFAIGQVAAEVAEASGNDAARAYAVWIKANAHNSLAGYDIAVQEYEQAAQLFVRAGMPHEAARVRIGHVDALMYLGQYDLARQLARSAREVFEAHGDTRSLATINLNLGNLHARLDQHDQALKYFQRALETYQALGDMLYVAIARVNLATSLRAMDDYLQAEKLYALARPVFDAADLQSMVAVVEHNLAHLQYARGNYTDALQVFENVRAIFQKLAIPMELAYVDLYESDIYIDLNIPEEALLLARRAEETFAEIGMNFELARARSNQAVALARLKREDLVTDLLYEARHLFAAEGNRVWTAHVDLQIAEVLARGGNPQEALVLARQAVETYQALGVKTKAAYGRIMRAQWLADIGEWEKALDELQRSARMLNGMTVPWLMQRIEAGYGRIYEGLGDPYEAAWHYQFAIERMEQVVTLLAADEHRTAYLADKLASYEALVTLTAHEDASVAYGWAERAKSRSLVDLLAAGVRPQLHVRDRDDVDAQRAYDLQALREELNWLYSRVTRGPALDNPDDLPVAGPDVWDRIQDIERQVTTIWRALQARHAEHLSLQRVAHLTVEEVQQGLDDGVALVEYFIARGKLLAFVVTSDTVQAFSDLGVSNRVFSLLEQLAFQLGKFQYGPAYIERHYTSLLDDAQDVLSQLHQTLFTPLQTALKGVDRLIIVPHGPLHALPFHALFNGKQYLFEQFAISYAPSAAVLKFCWEKPKHTIQMPLFIGVPDQRATGVNEEVQVLSESFVEAQVLLGDEATFDKVRAALPGKDVVHLAAHGLFRPNAPLLSGIQLADRWMAVQDVYNLELDASLVTLSACETGLGQVTAGDDLVGLTRGFLYAGAASLVVSLWMVDDDSVTRLMKTFYQALQRGVQKAQALRDAYQSLKEEYAHPYYWAPLALVGSER
ncbi:MAG: CHAT domain-containing protein [Chloroflexota bacterium]